MKSKWTYSTCYTEAQKYKSRSEFKHNNNAAYRISFKNEWIDDYTWFMSRSEVISKTRTKYSKDDCYKIALTCNSRAEFKYKDNTAYRLSLKNRWIDDYTWFMSRSEAISKAVTKYSKDDCYKIALTCKSRSELKKTNYTVWDTSRKNKWLDEYVWFENPYIRRKNNTNKQEDRPKDSMETSIFLQKVKDKWGDSYTFNIDTKYIGRNIPTACHCEKHNTINYVNPRHFIEKGTYNCGCSQCNREKKIDKDRNNYINKFVKRWGDGYSFDKLEYVDWKSPGIITCKRHGNFKLDQIRYALDPHYNLQPCPVCAEINKKNERNNGFLQRLNEKYGDKYTWITTDFGDYFKDKVKFICPKHGEVEQTLCTLLNEDNGNGDGCPKCKREYQNLKQSYSLEEAIEKAKSLECCKDYDFSYVTEWLGVKHKYTFRCKKHNTIFKQTFDCIFGNNSNGCPDCLKEYIENRPPVFTNEEFIERAREVHGNKYDYSKVEYKDNRTPVCIICQKHGEFWQTPMSHLSGCGCQKCHNSILETRVRVMLENVGIEYNQEYSIKKLTGEIFNKKPQRVDFFLPNEGICIECQGLQHFKDVKFNNKMSDEDVKQIYIRNKKSDIFKFDILKQKGYDIIYFFNKSFLDYDKSNWYNDKKCFHSIDDLKEYILSKSKGLKEKEIEVGLW